MQPPFNIPNWFDEKAKEYFERNTPRQEPLRALQVGVFSGNATQWLLDNCNIESIDDVDTWFDYPWVSKSFGIHMSTVEQYYDERFSGVKNLTKHRISSDKFFGSNEKTYNFIYIDGDHRAPQLTLDALNAFKVLERGGILVFDDYGDTDIGYDCKKPIDYFLDLLQIHFTVIEKGYQVWLRKK